MISRGLMQDVAIGLVICLAVVFATIATGSAADGSIPSQKVKNGQAGGGSASASGKAVSGIRPQQSGSNKSAPVKAMRRSVGANRHAMAAPEKFPKDGVYIWCDPDGLWTMFWKGRQSLAVNANVTARKPITVKVAVKATTSKVGGNQLKITSTSKARAGIVQFASSDSVQVSILINGKVDPNCVYVGSRLKSPEQFPLKLATRRTFAQKRTIETKTTTIHQSKETVLTVHPSKTPVQATRSSGNKGGGGGNKGGKAKK